MPAESPLAILSTPTEKEVEGFIALYRKKYEVELDPVDALRMLGGLIRFLYLTRTQPPEGTEGEPPPHPTQLTARKGRESRKKA